MCTKTIDAWKLGKKPNGKDNIVFSPPPPGKGEFLPLPCGQCMECRLERSRIWAMRCMHEASLHETNCFITLTFNDDFLDPICSLRKEHFQKFMKRLRKHLSADASASSRSVRYFHAGEYGDDFSRPHHHAILFGYDFPDKVLKVERNGNYYYESPLLTKLWSHPETGESYGFHEITTVSFETCAYVARYVCKKVTGEKSDQHYSVLDDQGNFHKRVPEFCTMSRRPGIGLGWYEQYRDTDVFPHDLISVRPGIKCKPPRYYSIKYETSHPKEYAIIKDKRNAQLKRKAVNDYDRQKARSKIVKARMTFLQRKLK